MPGLQIGRRDFFFFVPAVLLFTFTLFYLPVSSVFLSNFNLSVPIRKYLAEHSLPLATVIISSTFSVALQNGTFFFHSSKTAVTSGSGVLAY